MDGVFAQRSLTLTVGGWGSVARRMRSHWASFSGCGVSLRCAISEIWARCQSLRVLNSRSFAYNPKMI